MILPQKQLLLFAVLSLLGDCPTTSAQNHNLNTTKTTVADGHRLGTTKSFSDKNKNKNKNNNNNNKHEEERRALERKLGGKGVVIDEMTLKRYKAAPEGYRLHPSYYSETYLPRARETTDWAALTKKWGRWELSPLPDATDRPNNAFYRRFSNRDVPRDKFPDNAWQKDTAYLKKFLPEAIKLTERAMEAILEEYGLGKDMPGVTGTTREERDEKFRSKLKPIVFEGLKRRVLHAVVTEDRFTVAMGGHSAAAGHGNHFQQTYTLTIQRILEPIFARLGVKMTARNFGMGGLGTIQNSVASADIYGRDVDVLLWDSSMTEKSAMDRGIFAIQALVGMDRAPLLVFEKPKEIMKIHELTGADAGEWPDGSVGGWPTITSVKDAEKVPWAAQYFACPKNLATLCGERYVGECWFDRSEFMWQDMNMSFVPPKKQGKVGGRAGWHPGNREHQLKGRGFTYQILQALYEGLKMWNDSKDKVLDDEMWHVTKHYKNIKDKVLEHREDFVPWCQQRNIPDAFCLYRAKGRTENSPRANPWATSLRAALVDGPESLNLPPNQYDPPDVYNPCLHPPEDALDVLAIVENGVPFGKNMARTVDADASKKFRGPTFKDNGYVSKHNNKIQSGKGLGFVGPWKSAGDDGCTGEHDSFCHREGDCLLYGHNDGRRGISFDGFSGWQIYKLPKLEHGVIMIKAHTWIRLGGWKVTEGWCSENNKSECNSRALLSSNATQDQERESAGRQLKEPVPPYCDDFRFEFALDGKVTSWTSEELLEHHIQAARVVEFILLKNDTSWSKTQDVELAMRMTGCGRKKVFELTHIYWI